MKIEIAQTLSVVALLSSTATAFSVPDSYIGVVRRGGGFVNSTTPVVPGFMPPKSLNSTVKATPGGRNTTLPALLRIRAAKLSNSTVKFSNSSDTISIKAAADPLIPTELADLLPTGKQTGTDLKKSAILALAALPGGTTKRIKFLKTVPQTFWDQLADLENKINDASANGGKPDQSLLNQDENAWIALFNDQAPDVTKLPTNAPKPESFSPEMIALATDIQSILTKLRGSK
ncbi:hypothetical protein H072_11121 [Dactylellina haptotyla CBS 200.50]|uniref:Uncharacterized protein n=1 Tax=Dactylellina haptotyla (strain CBS 200.50) TaxID=1284197 RepID=S8A301_DACHA|nr:hypothetical protein H072_11121 [Dactylellina haptotyla CBS 200.50]